MGKREWATDFWTQTPHSLGMHIVFSSHWGVSVEPKLWFQFLPLLLHPFVGFYWWSSRLWLNWVLVWPQRTLSQTFDASTAYQTHQRHTLGGCILLHTCLYVPLWLDIYPVGCCWSSPFGPPENRQAWIALGGRGEFVSLFKISVNAATKGSKPQVRILPSLSHITSLNTSLASLPPLKLKLRRQWTLKTSTKIQRS